MRASRPAEQALRLATSSTTQRYTCRACRAQAARQFHTSVPREAEVPFYKRLQETLFGSKQAQNAEKVREEKRGDRSVELRGKGGEEAEAGAVEVKMGKNGQRYEIAALVDPDLTKNYTPATTWDGLQRVGSEEWVKARADRGEQYVGFVPKTRVELTEKQWQLLLHDIMVEILVLQKAGRPVGQICYPRGLEGYGPSELLDVCNGEIAPSADGTGITISFSTDGARKRMLNAIPSRLSEPVPQEPVLDEQESLDAPIEDAGELISAQEEHMLFMDSHIAASQDRSRPTWMKIPITGPHVKIALAKRILQLTGRRLSDRALSTSSTLSDLHHHLLARPKTKKLSQAPEIEILRSNVKTPNVTFKSNRQTPIHKEKAIGRWKVIEEELIARGLPVTGSRWQGAKVTVE
ncbi:hypothetical protein LTR62_004067 [Meristemomyces frigidus]|uniref:Large ribosomal subunit protein mL50 n=1 Tax=Meristemomyces frigidus TaxID=1508187 RepID=A0AAN7YKJ8_9PEZI|nr:hypothetical protein LTR62_004067 [Meristemomyces frigidus]